MRKSKEKTLEIVVTSRVLVREGGLAIAQTSAEVCISPLATRFPGGNHVPPGGPLLSGSLADNL